MKPLLSFLLLLLFSQTGSTGPVKGGADRAGKKDTRCYELRIYHCFPGRLDALVERFATNTTRIFEKHHMENIGYWLPVNNGQNELYYILAYPDRAARDSSWNAFHADPEWIEVARKSEEKGKIVEKVTSVFMTAAGISPTIKASAKSPDRTFELRTYTCLPGELPGLVKSSAEQIRKEQTTHPTVPIGYWTSGEKDSTTAKLICLLAYKSGDEGTVQPTSILLRPLPFSKIK